MTRASAWVGIVLGLIALASGVQEIAAARGLAPLLFGVVAGIVLLVMGALTLRGRAWAQIVMSAVGLVLLARHLPPYFRTYRPWPALAIILLGSFTFGLAILGMMLDRYQASGPGTSGTSRRPT
jgi:uncharacterized membrane protein (UPF0136 family)